MPPEIALSIGFILVLILGIAIGYFLNNRTDAYYKSLLNKQDVAIQVREEAHGALLNQLQAAAIVAQQQHFQSATEQAVFGHTDISPQTGFGPRDDISEDVISTGEAT